MVRSIFALPVKFLPGFGDTQTKEIPTRFEIGNHKWSDPNAATVTPIWVTYDLNPARVRLIGRKSYLLLVMGNPENRTKCTG